MSGCGCRRRSIAPACFHTPDHGLSRTMTTTLKFSIPTGFYVVYAYVFMLPFALLLSTVVWANKVSGVLYLCTDSLGIFDFIPPFVHSYHGDVYCVSPLRVNFTWAALLAGALLLPALVIWLLRLACETEQLHED